MTARTQKNTSDRRFVGRYVSSSQHYRPEAPTMAKSLAVFGESAEFQSFVASQCASVDCLFQGYTSPKNGDALRHVLLGQGIERAHIVAVDRIQLPLVYEQLGVAMPDIEFVHADACDLGDQFGDRKFDIIVQDFVLNCIAPTAAPALLSEAKRHLKPGGICLISFSTGAHAPAAKTKSLASVLEDWPQVQCSLAASLQEMARTDAELKDMERHLLGQSIFDDQTGHLTHVTDPSGQLEFFIPKPDMIGLFEAAGFEVSIADVRSATDYNGLECTRYRVIASHA